MAGNYLGKAAAEVIFQVLGDLFLDHRLKENKHKPEPGLDSDLILTNSDGAVDSGSLKMNMVAFPAVIDVKFLREVARQFIRSFLRFFCWHGMPCKHIYVGHQALLIDQERISLDTPPAFHQPVGWLETS